MTALLINGLGRSGTSWMHKTFDQHPNVFASFEPELIIDQAIVHGVQDTDDPEAARRYVTALRACHGLRAMRKRPILTKQYRSAAAHWARVGYMYGASVLANTLWHGGKGANNWPVPNFADLSKATHVLKSVALQFDMPRIARACPDLKIIYMLRHPCGQIHSHMRGVTAGKMAKSSLPPRAEMARLFDFETPAQELTESDFSPLEINAYRWAAACDVNYTALKDLPNVRMVRYEDLCADPVGLFRDLFDWVGLDWADRPAAFIDASLKATSDATEYHALVRNPAMSAEKWRSQMDPQAIETVTSICCHSAAAVLYPDLSSPAESPRESA